MEKENLNDNKNNNEEISTKKPIDDENITIKKQSLFRKMFLHSPIKYIVSIIIGSLFVILTLYIQGFNYLMSYEDGFFVAGSVLICVGLLSLLSNYGAFDLLSYSGKYVFNMSKKKKIERYPEYVENKVLIRKKLKYKWIPYIVVGILFILISIVIMIILK